MHFRIGSHAMTRKRLVYCTCHFTSALVQLSLAVVPVDNLAIISMSRPNNLYIEDYHNRLNSQVLLNIFLSVVMEVM